MRRPPLAASIFAGLKNTWHAPSFSVFYSGNSTIIIIFYEKVYQRGVVWGVAMKGWGLQ